MSDKPEFDLAYARRIAEAVVEELRPLAEQIEIVGSIRRRVAQVHDIDIVVMSLFDEIREGLWGTKRIDRVRECVLGWEASGRVTIEVRGDKKMAFRTRAGISVELYFAAPILSGNPPVMVSTWPTLKLIRTGSREHNIRLARRAKEMGMHLHADGQGITDARGRLLVVKSEEDIFRELGLPYVGPGERA
ncbi:MAG: hypothetical protein KJ042_05655 [Deltaproteobacteria bacterium]|nr:hypothetical protein [Deltaproteobacteria bacterium]